MYLVWCETYKLGIDAIDEQHKKLFEIVNDMYMAVENKEGDEKTSKILERLLYYAGVHFSTEEEMFQLLKYPEYENHRNEHLAMANKVEQLQKEYEEGSKTISKDVLDFLCNWLKGHTTGSDLEFAQYYKKNSI